MRLSGMHFSLWALWAVLSLTCARPAHVVHEKRALSAKWVKGNRVGAEAILPVRIGLTQQNLDKAHGWLMDVSDPASPNYGKHWTQEQVIEAFAPAKESLDAVYEWIKANGIGLDRIVLHDNKGWLAFHATGSEVEQLLKTKLYEFEAPGEGHMSIACDQYHVPVHIQPHVDYVTPGVKLAVPMKKRVAGLHKRGRGNPTIKPLPEMPIDAPIDANSLANCDKIITPACIRALYQVPKPEYTKIVAGNSMGLYENLDAYSQLDLDRFFANQTPYIPTGTHPILNSVDGGVAPVPVARAGLESDLDMELTYPLIWPQTITLYQVDDPFYARKDATHLHTGEFNTFLDALDGSYCTYCAYGECGDAPIDPVYPDKHPGGYKGPLQCGLYKPTNVISISYGVQEDDLPAPYQKRQCNEFLKLGLQGTSIMVASGDTGVAGIDPTPNGCLGPKGGIFNPTNPNSCPYVTNVGATEIPPGQTVHDPETAVADPSIQFYSSGGFSNIYPIPDYQKKALNTYFRDYQPTYASYAHFGLKSIGEYKGRYNRIGRGIPDVAANGINIFVFGQGSPGLVGGTSASSPIFASIINRINEERLRAGKSSLGFLNPALYGFPEMLNDIVTGSNPGCGTEGFSCVKGWDPVTGLGTPNYPKMKDYFLSLQ